MTSTSTGPAEVLQGLEALAREHYIGAKTRAREHSIVANRWILIHRSLAVAAAVLSAVAGGSLLSGSQGWATVSAGVLALLAAILSATDVALGAASQIDENKKAIDRFNALGSTIAYFRRVEVGDGSTLDEQQARYRKIMERRDALDSDSPTVPQWARTAVAAKKRPAEDAQPDRETSNR